jgi:hypothetical protein
MWDVQYVVPIITQLHHLGQDWGCEVGSIIVLRMDTCGKFANAVINSRKSPIQYDSGGMRYPPLTEWRQYTRSVTIRRHWREPDPNLPHHDTTFRNSAFSR